MPGLHPLIYQPAGPIAMSTTQPVHSKQKPHAWNPRNLSARFSASNERNVALKPRNNKYSRTNSSTGPIPFISYTGCNCYKNTGYIGIASLLYLTFECT